MAERPPAFQFYPADFLADERVMTMTNQELGCYIKLICYCWREGSIPCDVNKIARLCGENGLAMAELWLSLSPCFTEAVVPDYDEKRLIQKRLEKERQKQAKYRLDREKAGQKGAEVRWGDKLTSENGEQNGKIAELSLSYGLATSEPMANDSSSSSSSSSSSTSSLTAFSGNTSVPTAPPQQPKTETPKQQPDEPPEQKPPTPAEQFAEYWNEIAKRAGWPPVRKMTATRSNQFRLRSKDEFWQTHHREALLKAENIPGLCGKNDRDWKMDVDFFLRPDTVAKIVEGKYDRWGEPLKPKEPPAPQYPSLRSQILKPSIDETEAA